MKALLTLFALASICHANVIDTIKPCVAVTSETGSKFVFKPWVRLYEPKLDPTGKFYSATTHNGIRYEQIPATAVRYKSPEELVREAEAIQASIAAQEESRRNEAKREALAQAAEQRRKNSYVLSRDAMREIASGRRDQVDSDWAEMQAKQRAQRLENRINHLENEMQKKKLPKSPYQN